MTDLIVYCITGYILVIIKALICYVVRKGIHMNTKSLSIFFAVVMILISSMACSLIGGSNENEVPAGEVDQGEVESQPAEAITQPDNAAPSDMTSAFPLPDTTKIIQSDDELVVATVNMPLQNIVEFYRKELKKQGLVEDQLLTSITETTFSLVFEGTSNGKSLVVQGTDIGNSSVAFSVRYE